MDGHCFKSLIVGKTNTLNYYQAVNTTERTVRQAGARAGQGRAEQGRVVRRRQLAAVAQHMPPPQGAVLAHASAARRSPPMRRAAAPCHCPAAGAPA